MLPLIFYISIIAACCTYGFNKFAIPKTQLHYLFKIYVFIAMVFDFIGIDLWREGISPYLIYHIYAPIEIIFFTFICLSIFAETKSEKMFSIIMPWVIAIFAVMVDYKTNWNELDTSIALIEFAACLITSGMALGRLKRNYREPEIYILLGIMVYSVMNAIPYPKYHLLSNILMQVFFTASLVLLWKTDGVLSEGQRSIDS